MLARAWLRRRLQAKLILQHAPATPSDVCVCVCVNLQSRQTACSTLRRRQRWACHWSAPSLHRAIAPLPNIITPNIITPNILRRPCPRIPGSCFYCISNRDKVFWTSLSLTVGRQGKHPITPNDSPDGNQELESLQPTTVSELVGIALVVLVSVEAASSSRVIDHDEGLAIITLLNVAKQTHEVGNV